jgi:hypothetical protein
MTPEEREQAFRMGQKCAELQRALDSKTAENIALREAGNLLASEVNAYRRKYAPAVGPANGPGPTPGMTAWYEATLSSEKKAEKCTCDPMEPQSPCPNSRQDQEGRDGLGGRGFDGL